MRKDITEFLEEAKKLGSATTRFSHEQDAHYFYTSTVSRMKNDNSFNWDEYHISQKSRVHHYEITINAKGLLKKEFDKKEEYAWVIRNLTMGCYLYKTVFPKKLMNDDDLNWVLSECEEVLNSKVKITINEKNIAELERLGNGTETEVQSEVIFQDSNES